MRDRDDSVKLGVLVGFLKGLRHSAIMLGHSHVINAITRVLEDLDLEEKPR